MEGVLEDFQRYFNRLNDIFPPVLYSFLGLITSTVVLWHTLDSVSDQFQATFNDNQQRFDFIVVGAGSSGAVVATRLSQHYKVLLLEAGGEPNPLTYIPGLAFLMINQPHIDWQFKTVPQEKACLAMKNQECAWPRGKALGGTSNLNFLMYARGHSKDYDQWANITGDPRWTFESLMPYFKRSENYANIADTSQRDFHGEHGELRVGFPPYTGMADKFLEAATEMGYDTVDFNAKFIEGFSKIPYTQQSNGRRFGTYQAFLMPQAENKNLTVYKYSEAFNILFKENKEAHGVAYLRHGVPKIAFANKEIIISAGAIGSPKLLMLSGIGPKKHLESVNITTLHDLPVGKNLQDHISAFVGPFIVNQSITMDLDRDINPRTIYEFIQNGTGPLTSTGVQASGFLVSSISKFSGTDDAATWPDLQLILLGTAVYKKMPRDFQNAFNVKDGILQKHYERAKNEDSFQIITILSRPKTRGEIKLANSNPFISPLINPNYFQDPLDVKILVEGIKRAVDLVENSTVFQKMGGQLMKKSFPGCEDKKFRSDDYWECYIHQLSLSMYHPVGTCSMGHSDSKDAVVDSQLRVIGTRKLRVIDASVMPTIVSSNTNAACIMLGEMGAQLILDSPQNFSK